MTPTFVFSCDQRRTISMTVMCTANVKYLKEMTPSDMDNTVRVDYNCTTFYKILLTKIDAQFMLGTLLRGVSPHYSQMIQTSCHHGWAWLEPTARLMCTTSQQIRTLTFLTALTWRCSSIWLEIQIQSGPLSNTRMITPRPVKSRRT